ncbi:hypothetical protein GWE18_39300 [Bradyrhizobium sp. CSA112]|uniref:hypothetical protein n=1 Tax=Bradyrhizobium sp. CSA112 TaxID=2699170 RepID=UPI0023B05980|nr:hypothetical protein [Bradyrhizobium sp. CSA112]MDE5458697.1 hypothetical protein [Bradyrhizobium sp. CSA112]
MQAAAIVENPSQRRLTDMRTLTAGVPDRRAQDPYGRKEEELKNGSPIRAPADLFCNADVYCTQATRAVR